MFAKDFHNYVLSDLNLTNKHLSQCHYISLASSLHVYNINIDRAEISFPVLSWRVSIGSRPPCLLGIYGFQSAVGSCGLRPLSQIWKSNFSWLQYIVLRFGHQACCICMHKVVTQYWLRAYVRYKTHGGQRQAPGKFYKYGVRWLDDWTYLSFRNYLASSLAT